MDIKIQYILISISQRSERCNFLFTFTSTLTLEHNKDKLINLGLRKIKKKPQQH